MSQDVSGVEYSGATMLKVLARADKSKYILSLDSLWSFDLLRAPLQL